MIEDLFATLRFITTHPLGSRRPVMALWRYGRWQIESRLLDEVEFQWIEGSKLVARNGMTGATGNIYCGLHEFLDMAFLLHLLRPDDLFVDVGANIGSYTILASAVCGARTVAVEPDPDTVLSLQRNIEANGIQTRVGIEQVALGSQHGRVPFTVGQDTTNRVATKSDDRTRFVEMRTLDGILDGALPVFIKLDVEGYENQVIAGSGVTLGHPSLLAIQLECVDGAVSAKLKDLGFERASYDPFTRRLEIDAAAGHGDASQNSLFVRDADACRKRVEAAPSREILGQRV